jgi:protein-S-isoprenylcysteine O-methyltransferase Ste14
MTENTAEVVLVLMLLACLWGGRIHLRSGLLEDARKKPDIEKVLLLLLTFLTMGFIPLMDALGPLFEFADLRFSDEVAWLGLLFGGSALILLKQAQSDLDRYYRSSVRTRQRMPEEGVYRYMRHPFYTAMLLWSVAQLLLLQN